MTLVMLLLLLAGMAALNTISALVSPEPLSSLLQKHASQIAELKSVASKASVDLKELPYSNDVFFLRYCLLDSSSSPASSDLLLQQSLDWRTSPAGKSICQAAAQAVTKATDSSSWNNEVVLSAAPHASTIRQYLTPSNCITTTSSTNDLVYCIRAGAIDDTALMKSVTVDQMVEFFLYAKEVNALVSDQRSLKSDRLQNIVTCNDMSGVKLVGGSADFRQALSKTSNQAATIYSPNMAGPTLLVNLPLLLSALVKLFTPLFPAAVKERLKFEQGPLKQVVDLRDVASTSSSRERAEFVQQLQDILYS